MIKTQILEVWQGETASFPTLPSPGYLLFLQENEKKKPQAIWFLEASMCIDPITSKVKLSHNWPHSQHQVSSPSSATFLIISKGFFFFLTVISIEFTFSALPMFSQFWTDSMEHQASDDGWIRPEAQLGNCFILNGFRLHFLSCEMVKARK